MRYKHQPLIYLETDKYMHENLQGDEEKNKCRDSDLQQDEEKNKTEEKDATDMAFILRT